MTITQGTSPDTTVTTITIDPTARTTNVSQAATTTNSVTTGTGHHQQTTCTNSTNTTSVPLFLASPKIRPELLPRRPPCSTWTAISIRFPDPARVWPPSKSAQP